MKDVKELASSIDLLSQRVAGALKALGNGDAATPMGAIEAHGKCILDGADNIASAIRDLASAVRELAGSE
jgi:outer membrane murein-binding lipoprotein Lpp